VIVRT